MVIGNLYAEDLICGDIYIYILENIAPELKYWAFIYFLIDENRQFIVMIDD